jgi:hypothetical protein
MEKKSNFKCGSCGKEYYVKSGETVVCCGLVVSRDIDCFAIGRDDNDKLHESLDKETYSKGEGRTL